MAKVIDQHLGALRGKIGPNVFRMRGPKSFVGQAPNRYKKTKEVGAINNRMKFSILVDFASAINSNKTLKSLWKDSEYSGKSAYLKIISANYNQSGDNFMKLTAVITPEFTNFTVLKVVLDESVFEVTFNIIESIINTISPSVIFTGIIVLTHPKEILSKKPKKNRKFIIVEQMINDFSFNLSDNQFSFKCPEKALEIINQYKKAVVYFAIVSTTTDKPPVGLRANGFVAKGLDIHEKELKAAKRINDIINEKKTRNAEKDLEFSINIR